MRITVFDPNRRDALHDLVMAVMDPDGPKKETKPEETDSKFDDGEDE